MTCYSYPHMKALFTIVVIIILGVLGYILWMQQGASPTDGAPIATALFQCDGGSSIQASFYNGASTPGQNGGPPTPGGHADLTLSDGRALTLQQTISADGTRYSNGNPSVQGSETVIFWNKGNTAFLQEGNTQTYSGCITVAPDPGGLPQVYEDSSAGFSIRYPDGYTPDANYTYQEMGPGKDIPGVKFTIDPSIATGTNLGSDTYFSVEHLASVSSTAECSASDFLDQGQLGTTTIETLNGTTYSVATSTGAGAGNRYEEDVYALPGTNPCTAIRYFIHYGVIENYPPGAVQQFDEASLLQQFDSMRDTLVIGQ